MRIAGAPLAAGAAGGFRCRTDRLSRAPALALVGTRDAVPFLVDLRALFADSVLARYQAEVTYFGTGASGERR